MNAEDFFKFISTIYDSVISLGDRLEQPCPIRH